MNQLRSAIEFDPDVSDRPATALRLDFSDYQAEVPTHQHRKGQLVLALHGAVTCTASQAVWIVPPQCAVWIPSATPHSNRATWNARLSYLFVEPGAAALPDHCCALAVSPLLREMIDRLADEPQDYALDSHAGRLARVLLDELTLMPAQELNLPVSDHPKIRMIAEALTLKPGDRSTLAEWAARVAVSERSLRRLMEQETGLTFGRWRQQLHAIIALRELAGGASVQSVADDLGYQTSTAFIEMFKKTFGQTPARYFAGRTEPHSASTSAQ